MRLPSRRLPRKPFVLTLALAGGLAACGGRAADTGSSGNSGSGGTAASGGAGGSGGTSGSTSSGGAGGSNPGCPTNLPGNGTACAGSLECEYPFCGGVGQAARCVGGVWQIEPHGSCNPPPVTCPSSLPAGDAPCSGDQEGMSCDYPSNQPCCPPENATCRGGRWQVLSVDCNPPPPLPCPASPPVSGTACGSDPCQTLPAECTYGDCETDGYQLVSSCDGTRWNTAGVECPGQPCEGLDFCGCYARPDCQFLSDSCICPCDYHCAGEPECACGCGGGNYLGCAPR